MDGDEDDEDEDGDEDDDGDILPLISAGIYTYG